MPLLLGSRSADRPKLFIKSRFMRFLPASIMASVTPLAKMLCFGCLDNWNVINGGHSEPGSCGCRHSASPNAASTCYRGDGNRVRLQVTCTPCPVAARGGKCCRVAETVLYGVQFHTLLRVARAAEQLGSGYGFVGLQPGACPRQSPGPCPGVRPGGTWFLGHPWTRGSSPRDGM